MGNTSNRLKINAFFATFLAFPILLLVFSSPLDARKPIRWRAKKIVVIDPGHGGHETGARGPNGVLEKDVALQLGTRIETELKSRFKVQLTRSDDFGLEITRRTDIANHLQADVFISIHAGGSYRQNARGLNVFFFQENSAPLAPASSTEENSWDRLQLKHVRNSEKLAESIQRRLEEGVPGARCQVDAAPLLVLRGADMPAVLIEIGYLTNPEDEQRLGDADKLNLLGRAIAVGVNDFLRMVDGRPEQ